MKFNAKKELNRIISWGENFLAGTEGKPIIVGISGGKDSTITAAALCEIVGVHRVLGVRLPQDRQYDIATSRAVCEHLGIQSIEINIGPAYRALLLNIKHSADNFLKSPFNSVVTTNTPARMRMTALYAVANQLHGRVANTCNLSESFVGWDTKWGDQCGDFGLFQDYTATEVKAIGRELGIDNKFIDKAPEDGMCGKTDEEKWGFSYDYLDAWIRRGGGYENETDKRILEMHVAALHKLTAIQLPHPEYSPAGSHSLLLGQNDPSKLLSKRTA